MAILKLCDDYACFIFSAIHFYGQYQYFFNDHTDHDAVCIIAGLFGIDKKHKRWKINELGLIGGRNLLLRSFWGYC
jgi:hypothetical protein